MLNVGQKGLGNHSSTRTNADVYLRIYDEFGRVSEPISLRRSTKHSNPFEKGNIGLLEAYQKTVTTFDFFSIDSFDIGTKEPLENIFKLELYHNETGFGHGWDVEYVNILDNLTGHNYCFLGDQSINNGEHIILDKYTLNTPCGEMDHQRIESKSDAKDRGKRRFTVRTKTGRVSNYLSHLVIVFCQVRKSKLDQPLQYIFVYMMIILKNLKKFV